MRREPLGNANRLFSTMLEIDGSYGEGGGQILRSALCLAMLTGTAFHLTRLREGRQRPGLRPQHLQAVQAAARVSRAWVSGAELDSRELSFAPTAIAPGSYRFDIGTAGAASLVLQTIAIPLGLSGAASRVVVVGGTHVPWSPCFHYLAWHWLVFVRRIGLRMQLELTRPGFYPPGGGQIDASIEPAQRLDGLDLTERGELLAIDGLSAAANLPAHVAERQHAQVSRRLQGLGVAPQLDREHWQGRSPGSVVVLRARFAQSQACFTALGARGKPAERVADEAVDALLAFLKTNGAVDAHLADQLLLPLALARGTSIVRTACVTRHLLTNAWLVQQFLPVRIRVEGEIGDSANVVVVPPEKG